MKKLKLDVAELRVETFDTRQLGATRKGTVFARESESDDTCYESCLGTCPWQWTCWGSVSPMECCA